jgi:deoxyhypusine synthase
MSKPITEFIEKYYLHFNAAALVDASKGYVVHLKDGGKMMITLPEQCLLRVGKFFREIRQDKVDFISVQGQTLKKI